MRRTIARLACTWLTALAVALPPRGAVAQDTTAPMTADYVAAVAQLDSALFTLEEARDAVDEAAFNPAALAESLGKDPARIYDFVKYQIGYHPYSGLLRFGPGALMQRAGNSCDKAALLGEMLIAAGEKVQFVLGELSPSDAERLAGGDDGFDPSSTAPSPFRLGREPADVASLKASGLAASTIDAVRADEILYRNAFLAGLDEGLADARSLLKPALDQIAAAPAATAAPRVEAPYCWLQRQTPAGFVDLDPTAPWLEAGQRIGEGRIVPALPLTLSPKLGVTVMLERNIGDKAEAHNVLTAEGRLFQAVNEIELNFLPYGNKADDVLGEPGPQTAYRPVFSLNGIAFAGAGFDLTGLLVDSESDKASPIDKPIDILNCIFGCPDKPPAPTRTLNGLTLEITVESADGRKIVERRPLLARPAGAPADTDTALSEQINQRLSLVSAGGRIATDYVVAREIDQVLWREPLLRAVLDAGHKRPIKGDIAALLDGADVFPVQLIDHLRLRHALTEFSSREAAAPSAYAGFPQIIGLREGNMPAAAANRSGALIDIVSSSLDSLYPASAGTRAEQGIVDTLAEYLLAGGGNAENAHSILVAAATGGVGTRVIAPGDAAALGSVIPDALSLRGMREDLAAGYSLLAPERAVPLGDRTAYGWYRFRPETGELIGRGPLGGDAETPILTAIVAQQVQILPASLAICVAITAFAHEIAGVQELINEAFGEATPGGPPPPRSFRRVAAEYVGCVLLGQALGAAASFGARAAAAAAGAFGGLKAFAGGRPRPSANRPPVIEDTVAPRYAEAEGQPARAGAVEEYPGAGAARQAGLVDSRADTVAGRPRVRPGAAGETLAGGAGGARPAPVQAGAPPPPRQPMTARESFNLGLERQIGPGASKDPRYIISRARWEAMTPQQRMDAIKAFHRLRQHDPFGNPGRQLRAVMEQPIDTPPLDRLARAALDSTNVATNDLLGPNVRELAELAGVSPAEMRTALDAQARELYGPNARVVIDRYGMAHMERMTPEVQAMTPHERALYDLRNQGDDLSARRDAKLRAERDTTAGLTPDQSIAGQAHYNEIAAAEAMRRTGQTPAEFEANVAAYLETQGLTPEQARAEARAYMHGPDQGGTPPPVDRPPDPSEPPGPASPSSPSVPVEEVALAPEEAVRILDAEMSTAKPEPPAPAPDAQRPSWWDALDTPENAARTSDPQGMSPPERARYEQVFREYQDARQMPEGPAKDVRMWELRQERQGLLEAGSEHQRRVDLRRNQQEATNFNVGAQEPNAPTRQVNPENGVAPFRRLVKDDQVYLRSIMEGSGIQPSQSKVYVERINRYTQQILDGGQFPRGKDGAPVKFGRLPNGELIIVSGHHRVIAGQIASRLTGRPLLPQAGGPPSIIPADALTIVDNATRTGANWGQNGMGVLSWPEGAPGP